MKKTADQVMLNLWRRYIAGDEEAFNRVSLGAFRTTEIAGAEETVEVENVYAIEAVAFDGEE